MSSRTSVQDVYGYMFAGLVWVALTVASGSLPWMIIGGLGASGVALAISRQWKGSLATGVVVAGIVSVFGVIAMFSPGWYKGLL